MKHRWICLVLSVLLTVSIAFCQAELAFPSSPFESVSMLKTYLERVNVCLGRLSARPLDQVFECYSSFAVIGYSDSDVPENVELSVNMESGELDSLELRCSDFSAFAPLCAALEACAGAMEDELPALLKNAEVPVRRALNDPLTSFSDRVVSEKGDRARVYYAYEINPWGDQVNYLVMTLIFPRQVDMSGGLTTPPPNTRVERIQDGSDDEGDYTPYDEGTHLEVFVTETPEPDSAAGDHI